MIACINYIIHTLTDASVINGIKGKKDFIWSLVGKAKKGFIWFLVRKVKKEMLLAPDVKSEEEIYLPVYPADLASSMTLMPVTAPKYESFLLHTSLSHFFSASS